MTYEQAYQILDVNEQASTEEIKSAYKVAAKKYHPDLYKGDKKVAEEKMKQINEAYALLSKPHATKHNPSSTTRRSSNYTYEQQQRREKAQREYDEILKKILEEIEKKQEESRQRQREVLFFLRFAIISLTVFANIGLIYLFIIIVNSSFSNLFAGSYMLFTLAIFLLLVIIFSIAGCIWLCKNVKKL